MRSYLRRKLNRVITSLNDTLEKDVYKRQQYRLLSLWTHGKTAAAIMWKHTLNPERKRNIENKRADVYKRQVRMSDRIVKELLGL